MNRQLLWKLCITITTGVVALFYAIDLLAKYTEEDMSMLAESDRQQLTLWGEQAEKYFYSGDQQALNSWVDALKAQEQTWISIVSYNYSSISGDSIKQKYADRIYLGRDIDWKVHLYFDENPVMDIPFKKGQHSFLIQLPERMRPGSYWQQTRIVLQIFLPMLLLAALSLILYKHIMDPLRKLEKATRELAKGNFDVRVCAAIGTRSDEISDLANTFDQMASRMGALVGSQRQLIADLSHELRTPLTRLDIAVQSLEKQQNSQQNLKRVERESQQIRQLVDDTLSLAWLENEQPELNDELLDVVDLIDVIVEDARFEFTDRCIIVETPNSAVINKSSHRAVGQAIENILRNALRYTPKGKNVTLRLIEEPRVYSLFIIDQGPGVPNDMLEAIFQPFFRLDKSRSVNTQSFGLGLALARRQLKAVNAQVVASNMQQGGLSMLITLPKKQ